MLAVMPESLAVDVPVDAAVEITFSEKVDRRTLEKALWVVPGGVPQSISLSGPVARVRLRDALPDSATVGVLVTTLLKDPRNLALAEPVRWTFSTGPTVAAGAVTGTVELVGNAAPNGVLLVGLFDAGGDTLPDPARATPMALTQAGTGGTFALSGLPTDGRLRFLAAMLDRDGNREIVGKGEFTSAPPESLILTPEDPTREMGLRLIDPEAPCDITGTLARAEGDTIDVWVAAAAADSAAASPVEVKAMANGSFRLRRLRPGLYRLTAWCDLNANGRRDPEEGEVDVAQGVAAPPGGTVDLGEVPGPACSGTGP